MSLFSDVLAVLERAGIDHALIGAAAMALHGVSRANKDAWDVQSLLESHELADDIKSEVDQSVSRLPAECGRLWKRILEES